MPTRRPPSRIPCRVEFYAGSKAEETPTRVHFAGQVHAVERVLERRRLRDAQTGRIREEFTILLEGRPAILRQTPTGRWSLVCGRGLRPG